MGFPLCYNNFGREAHHGRPAWQFPIAAGPFLFCVV